MLAPRIATPDHLCGRPTAPMAPLQYEVALFGEFFAKDLTPILNRITLHCESSEPMHSREVVFEPLDDQLQRDRGEEPTLLRARKELIVGGKKIDSPWCVSTPPVTCPPPNRNPYHRHLYSYLKPESARVHPEATVRPWATVQVEGDAVGFAAALGYEYVHLLIPTYRLVSTILISRRRSQIYKRGYCFRKGSLIILMFQQEQVHYFIFLPYLHPGTNSPSSRSIRKPCSRSQLMRIPFGKSKLKLQNPFATPPRRPSVQR